jgi:hypothetical protein
LPEYVGVSLKVAEYLRRLELDERNTVITGLLEGLDAAAAKDAGIRIPSLVGHYRIPSLGYSFVYRELTAQECSEARVKSGFLLMDVGTEWERVLRALGG